LHGFALALIIGILVGTYSSIYVAGSLALSLGLTRQHLLPPTKEALDDRP
jgi:preprotein translocase subunit SecF